MSNQKLASNLSLLGAASGATRLSLAADGSMAVAELAGSWKREEYGANADAAPPLLKVIDRSSDAVTATVSGWLLAPPRARSDGFFLTEDGEELRYQVRSFGGTPLPFTGPPGLWAVKFTAATADRLLLGLWRPSPTTPWAQRASRRQELYLASLDPAQHAAPATRTLTLLTSYYGETAVQAGVAIDQAAGLLYLADVTGTAADGAPITIHALDLKSLESRWSASCERPRGGLAAATGDLAVSLTVTGDGAHLIALVGTSSPHGLIVERGLVFDARTGAAHGALAGSTFSGLWTVGAAFPAPGDTIGIGSYLESRVVGTHKLRFLGLRVAEPAQNVVQPGFDLSRESLGDSYERLRELVPTAFAWDERTHGWLVAVGSYEWARMVGVNVGDAGAVPAEPSRGQNRPEIKGLSNLPPTWHRPERPRVAEWLAQQR